LTISLYCCQGVDTELLFSYERFCKADC